MADMSDGDDDAFLKLTEAQIPHGRREPPGNGQAAKAARFRKIKKHARARCAWAQTPTHGR